MNVTWFVDYNWIVDILEGLIGLIIIGCEG